MILAYENGYIALMRKELMVFAATSLDNPPPRGSYKDNTITVINGTTDKVSGTFTIGKDYINHIHQLVVNPKTNIIYATGKHDICEKSLGDCNNQDRNPVSKDSASGYNFSESEYTHNVVFVINGNTGKLMDRVSLYGQGEDGKEGGVDNLAVNPNTTKLYASSFYDDGNNGLYVIDRSNTKDSKTIEIPVDGDGVKDIITNPKTNVVYFITSNDDNSVFYIRVMDGQTNRILKNISLPEGIYSIYLQWQLILILTDFILMMMAG